jgi:hypothetical protein
VGGPAPGGGLEPRATRTRGVTARRARVGLTCRIVRRPHAAPCPRAGKRGGPCAGLARKGPSRRPIGVGQAARTEARPKSRPSGRLRPDGARRWASGPRENRLGGGWCGPPLEGSAWRLVIPEGGSEPTIHTGPLTKAQRICNRFHRGKGPVREDGGARAQVARADAIGTPADPFANASRPVAGRPPRACCPTARDLTPPGHRTSILSPAWQEVAT